MDTISQKERTLIIFINLVLMRTRQCWYIFLGSTLCYPALSCVESPKKNITATTSLLVGEPIVHAEVKEHGTDGKKFAADEEEKAGASDAEEPV